MSDILIKGMEMPKNCEECQLLAWGGGYVCMASRTSMEALMIKARRKDCPLIEIPTPHGRLIDADVLKQSAHLDGQLKTYIDTWIDSQSTVIEGSET